MKKPRVKKQFLDELRKVPNVSYACDKVGISRNTPYDWRKKSPEFAKQMDLAEEEGDSVINDLAESRHFMRIKNDDTKAVYYHLDHRHPKYKGGGNPVIQESEDLATENSIEIAEKNVQSLLKNANVPITKWYLERNAANQYRKVTMAEMIEQDYEKRRAEEFIAKRNEEIKWENMSSGLRKHLLEKKRKMEEEENKKIEDIDKKI